MPVSMNEQPGSARRAPSQPAGTGSGAATTSFAAPTPTVSFADLAGIEAVEKELYEAVVVQFQHPDIFSECPDAATRGVLLHGASGTGKTATALALAQAATAAARTPSPVAFFRLAATEIVAGLSGESEQRLRGLFDEALASAPSIVFIDDIDVIAAARDQGRAMESRVISQLGACLERLTTDVSPQAPVVVVGATSRLASIDLNLRREGRFSKEIQLPIPDVDARRRILDRIVAGKDSSDGRYGTDVRSAVGRLAVETPGYVGADLKALAREATLAAIRRTVNARSSAVGPGPGSWGGIGSLVPASAAELGPEAGRDAVSPAKVKPTEPAPACPPPPPLATPAQASAAGGFVTPRAPSPAPAPSTGFCVHLGDFLAALRVVQPTAQREGFGTVPNTTWRDIGALDHVRVKLSFLFAAPIHHRAECEAFGLTDAAGVLMFGPPGCGKTLVAKAVANASGCSFISVKGPELLNKYVGESERAVRAVFERARASEPCIVFFDELDSLVPARSGGENQAAERVVNQFLTELDGAGQRGQVFVLGATNRPELIDKALLRNGRFGEQIYIPLPDKDGRRGILAAACRHVPLDGRDAPADSATAAATRKARPKADALALRCAAGAVPPMFEVNEVFAEAGFTSMMNDDHRPPSLPEWANAFADGRTDGYSGADMAALVDHARRAALAERIEAMQRRAAVERDNERAKAAGIDTLAELPALPALLVAERHFQAALTHSRPSVSPADRAGYEQLRHTLEGK